MSSPPVHAPPTPPDLPSLRLAALRSELDRVDDLLHDTLMRRAELTAQVGALRAKGPTPLRPGREAAIIRRLLARNRGALDPAVLVRLWREMMSGFTTVQQQRMVVAVEDAGLRPVVERHFGLLTEVVEVGSATAAVGAGRATVAVLRWPGDWWTALLDGRAATLHVVARLPFWGRGSGPEAMVLTEAAPDPSGEDRTLVGARLPQAGLRAALTEFGAGARVIAGSAEGPSLVELDGFVEADDRRLGDGARVLGAYATQIGVFG